MDNSKFIKELDTLGIHLSDIQQEQFDRYYEFLPIRKVSISCGGLVPKKGVQLNLFENSDTIENEEKINEAIDEIKNKFGKNSLIKASSLLPDSTAIERNTKIGGHHE